MKSLKKKKLLFSYGSVIWVLLIGLLSLIPSSNIPRMGFIENIQIDKVVHIAMYFIFVVIIVSLWHFKKVRLSRWRMVALAVFCLAYSILLEAMQYAMHAGRHFDFYDIIANFLGILLGFLVFNTLLKKIRFWELN